ncbi:MAG: hypothetical protein ABI216_08755 [Devosia sp.]
MRLSTLSVCTLAVVGTLSPLPVLADDYTCEDDGPCIIQADDLGGFQVFLKWSRQGTRYDFFKTIVGQHGAGVRKEYPVKGRNGGAGKFSLMGVGDYEITVAGCFGSRKRPDEASCDPSSEKVRMNLYK